MRHGLLAGLVLAGTTLAWAHPARAAGDECTGIDPADTAFTAAEVSPGIARLNFVDSPRASSTRSNAFLVPGDAVVLSRAVNGYGCASYLNTSGRATAGWLPLDALRPVPEQRDVTPAAWAGRWAGNRGLEQQIQLRPRSVGLLHVEGAASSGPANGLARAETGALEADLQPQGNALAFSLQGDTPRREPGEACRVRMLLLEPYLMVQDNHRCGGPGVSFSGVYRRG